ncbi:helix-turn-helix domain-containing protein [Propionibacterium acidifaciens]|uniref:helix-turn-helix domain-containing protein n=1 Tax=Propionibacterium acidifaciens TaxID=556499 RepID=UPI003985DF4A
MRATFVYHRSNRTQTELAESFGVCQSSISRVINRWTPRLAEALKDFIPTVEDLDPSQTPHRRRHPRHRRRHPRDLLELEEPARPVLRKTPPHRPQPPSRLRPDRTSGPGV